MSNPRGDNSPHRGGASAADQIDVTRLGRAAQIRCAADGEAPAEVIEQLERDQDARDAIAGERALRDRVAKVMGGESAPAELRSAIEAMFAREREADQEPSRAVVGPAQTRSRSFWARRTVLSALAAAAAVALATLAGVLFVANRAASPLAADVIAHFENEHNRCAELGVYFERKMSARDAEQAQLLVREALRVPSPTLSLSGAGFLLSGAGRCSVPGPGASGHVIYQPRDERAGTPPISLFLQVDTGQLNLRDNVCYDIVCGPEGRDRLAVWRHGGLIYYVYCPDGADQLPMDALMTLGAPHERITIGA